MAFTLYSDLNGLQWIDKPLLENVDAVYQKFINLFSTSKEERLDLPEYGAAPEEWVFEIIDDLTALSIFQNVIEEVERWIPMAYIDIQNSTIEPNEDENRYDITFVIGIKGLEDNQFSKFDFTGVFAP